MKKSILFATIATILLIQTTIGQDAPAPAPAQPAQPAQPTPNLNGGTNEAAYPSCEPNQYLNAQKVCTACGNHVLRCRLQGDQVKVEACIRGKFVNDAGACADCHASCEVCKDNTQRGCQKLKPGYMRLFDPARLQEKVVQCSSADGANVAHCTKCAFKGNAIRCLECARGKYLKHTAEVKNDQGVVTTPESWACTACTTNNCDVCKDDKCTRCGPKHWEDMSSGTMVCQDCTAAQGMNCAGAANAGFGKCDAFKGCYKCPEQFSKISAATGKYTKRAKCFDCKGLDANCLFCTQSKCLACKAPFAMKKDGSGCAKLRNQAGNADVDVDVNNCQSAKIHTVGDKDVYKCEACNPGFYADQTGTCKRCPDGCLFCKEAGKCKVCRPGGYFDATQRKCVRCSVQKCRLCSSATKCSVCAPGHFAAQDGSCKPCHFSCAECVDGTKTGCLQCKGTLVLTVNQKKPGVSYENAAEMFDKVDKPPSGKELLAMNFQMVRAMKTAPAQSRRVLRTALTTQETQDFKAMDTLANQESDKMTTDMSDDKAINEIWNNGGEDIFTETDAQARTAVEGKAKKVRKMVGMCMRECPSNKQGMGFFYDKKSQICFKCKSDCQKCGIYEGECSTCGWGMYEVENSTAVEIEDEDGQPTDFKAKTCARCHASCKRCSGPAENQCKGCSKGFQLRAGKCVAGGRCKSGEVQVDSADTECVEDDGSRCKECKNCSDSNCHRCSDANSGSCKMCKKGYTRSNSGSCIKCSAGCLKCRDANTCLMCKKEYFLMENSRNSNSSARAVCVKRCPPFYKPVSLGLMSEAQKSKYKGDDGNADANDAVRNNVKAREAYFKAKQDFDKGKVTREQMEAKKAAIGNRRLLAGWNAPPERQVLGGGVDGTEAKKDPVTGKTLDTADLALKDLSDGQPLDSEVEKFVNFRGVCKPCEKGCRGGCAEGYAYREGKCALSCNMTGEQTKTLGGFSVCICPEGTFRNKTTMNCDPCDDGCGKCQAKGKCDQCGASQYLQINPQSKKRECVASCPTGFVAKAWGKLDKNVKEIFTKSKKQRNEEKKKKFRFLAANATNTSNATKGEFGNQTDKDGFYKPTAKELEFEKNMTERDVLAEVQEFKAVEFAGMCEPCLTGCKACAPGFFLKASGKCVKRCDPDTEDTVFNQTTKQGRCVVDQNPRLKIVWGSKKDEKDLMDDAKVTARKNARKQALTSGDADADLLEASALGKSVEEEAEELKTGLQDPMENLVLKATWNKQMTGTFEWQWNVRKGVDNIPEFLKGVNVNTDSLTIPTENLANVDLKEITIAVKAKQGDQRYETEFSFNMHKKPEIKFVMPGSVQAGERFQIQIDFDGAKLERAELYVLKVPSKGGYQDPETGVVITEKDAERQIKDVEDKNKNKLYKKGSEEEDRKKEKQAAGGADNELKRYKLSKRDFANGKNWWKKQFALKVSKQDFNVLLKLKACGKQGCFVRRKFLKVVKISDANLEKFAKEKLSKFKTKDAVKNMDADEIMDSLSLLKEQGKSKKRSCKADACEKKDKSGKKIDAKEVQRKDNAKKARAAELKKEYEAKVAQAKAEGKTLAPLSCPKGQDETGASVECSGAGDCTMGKKSGKGRCSCWTGFAGRACQFTEQEKEEHKQAKKNAILKMKEDAAAGKLVNAKAQKDFLKSVLADNDDEVDLDPEVADELVRSQKSYAEELRKKFKRRKEGKTDATDADFEVPTKEELADMLEQTLKLRKQRKLAKDASEDQKEFNKNTTNSTNGTKREAGALTDAEREAKKAERAQARAAKKEEMKMIRDLQAVQGQSLLEEMTAGGKKTAVAEQSYGDTYMKTTALDADSIDQQMHADASGERKMQIGKGSSATTKPADAVSTTTAPAAGNTTQPANLRLLQDAKPTSVAPSNGSNNTEWKKLKKEEDFMRVVVNKKMFEKGGPLFGIKKPIIMFNKHGADYVKEFPKGKKDSFDPTTGKKKNVTKAAAAKKANLTSNAASVQDGDDQLNDTVAQQVLELEFINGETMDEIPIKNLTKGMLQICMMMKNEKQKIQYVNEENDQFQDDGITQNSLKQQSTQDETNQRERKGYEMCVDLTHATTFATIDGDDTGNSSLFSYSMMVLMALLAVLFFKQE